ncbi:MAG: hypothetical protein ACQETH_10600 [Candidatus Rifleibacteriota bacterium]
MSLLKKIIFFFILLTTAVFSSGCIEKTLNPEAELEITSVEPHALYVTATDTASLPTTDVTVTSINTIPCNLESWWINYYTSSDEPIPSLKTIPTSLAGKLEAEGTLTITTSPYSTRVVDLFELSGSNISPIVAEMNFVFKDYNGNHISKTASCLLFEPDPAQ